MYEYRTVVCLKNSVRP